MTHADEERAGATFDHLERLAEKVNQPGALADAIQLVENASIAPLDTEAIRYYVSEGRPLANLAEIVWQAGTNAFVAARFALGLSPLPALNERATMRRIFQDEIVSLLPSLTAATPGGLAGRLITALAMRLGVGLQFLKRAEDDSVCAAMAARDLFEAAAVAALLANLVEQPVAEA
jgi:hypothetical protein